MKKICFFLSAVQLAVFLTEGCAKNNLVYDALLTPNLSVEFSPWEEMDLGYPNRHEFLFYENDATANGYKTKKWSHWLVQPEIRYWICETFNGWFLGLHAHGGQMNVGGINIPFIIQNHSKEMKDYRYEGYFYGGGISTGYHWILSSRFSVEASLGLGYARVKYDRFRCTSCGKKDGKGKADYLGPTKLAVSIIYIIK